MPDVKWDDVGGLEDIKRDMMEAIEWPLKYPELFKRLIPNHLKGYCYMELLGTGKPY